MKIAAVLNVYGDEACARDTLDSMRQFFGDRIFVLVEGSTWNTWGKTFATNNYQMKGFTHVCRKSPYRNVALGISEAWQLWKQDIDWLCYCEADVLFASDRFMKNLEMAERRKVWMLGNDGSVDDRPLPLIEGMLNVKFRSVYYLLGCCQFFHRDFLAKLDEVRFFEKFLFLTNGFPPGYFPNYSGYDISEHVYPTLCRHFGGAVGVFATWDGAHWHGAHRYFPMRWKPELDTQAEDLSEASLCHPVKAANHPLRVLCRKKRQNV